MLLSPVGVGLSGIL